MKKFLICNLLYGLCLLNLLHAQHKVPINLDANPGSVASSSATSLTNINGVLYFAGNPNSIGIEPLKITGSTVSEIVDVLLGGSGSTPRHFTFYNGFTYYVANKASNITGLYYTNGSLGNNTLVAEPSTTPNAQGLMNNDTHGSMIKAGNFLYFTAQNTNITGSTPYNVELWQSNGTTVGTMQTPAINTNIINNTNTTTPRINGSALPRELTAMNIGGTDYLFFTADPNPFQRSSSAANIELDSLGNRELYVRNANALATDPHTVIEINPATASVFTFISPCSSGNCTVNTITSMAGSRPVHLTPYGNQLYFIASSNGNAGTSLISTDGLWRSNGVTATQVSLPAGTRIDRSIKMAVSNNLLYFAAVTATAGRELWKFDATTATASMVKDINGGTGHGLPLGINNIFNPISGLNNLVYTTANYNWVDINGILYFTANDGINGIELWKTDGTNAGTVMISPLGSTTGIITGAGDAYPRKLANVNGVLYFIVRNSAGYHEVWKHIPVETCDASFSQTSLYYDIYGINPSSIANALLESRVGEITRVGNDFYFIAQVDDFSQIGAEPWYAEGCPVASVDYSPEPAIVNTVCKTATVTTATPGVTFTFTNASSLPNTATPANICPSGNCFCSTSLGGAIDPATGVVNLNHPSATNGIHKICYQYKAPGACVIPICFDLNIQGAAVADILVETVAGDGTHGFLNSTPTASRFRFNNLTTPPVGNIPDDSNVNVAFSPDGTKMYISDEFNHCIRQLDFNTNAVTTLAGLPGFSGSIDGIGTAAGFRNPAGITTDQAGNIYVADKGNHLIRRINPTNPANVVVTTIAGVPGSISGGYLNDNDPLVATFSQPSDVAIDASGNIYVADKNNHAIRKISPTGVVSTLAGSPAPSTLQGFVDGTGTAARFNYPCGIDFDANGNILVADRLNHAIRQVTPAGVVTTLAGTGASGMVNGANLASLFNQPTDITVDAGGKVYVADRNNHRIRLIEGGNVTTYAGEGTAGYLDGTAPNARFQYPIGIADDPTNKIFVTDKNNARIRRVRLNNPGGQINGSTVVCSGTNSGTLTLVNYQGAPSTAGITRWESSTNGGTTWTNLGNPASATFNFSNLTATTIFRVILSESACGTVRSDIATVTTIVPPTPVVTPTAVCGTMPATNVPITVTASGAVDGEYEWVKVISGVDTPQAEDSGTFVDNISATTTYKVRIKKGTCLSPWVNVVATVYPPPTPVVSGNSTICTGTAQTFTTNNNIGNTYEWRVDGVLQLSTTNSLSYTWADASAGSTSIITVKETTPAPASCAVTSANFSVTVNGTPAAQAITGASSVCLNSLQNYSIGGSGTFAWSITGGGATPNTGTGNTFSTTWGSVGSATITWIETVGGCPRTNTQTITINDLPTTKTIAGGTNACLGVDKAFSYTPAGTNTSNWTVTNGTGTASIVGANNTNMVSINGTVAGNVNLCVTETDPLTGCSRQHCATITINNLPTVQTIAGNGAVCINTSQTYSVAQVGGNTYSGTITGGNPTNPTFTGTSVTTTFQAAGTANICITETNPITGCVNTYCRNITINDIPAAQAITGASSVCLNSLQNYSIGGSGTFTWSITGGGATPNTGTGNTFSTTWGSVGAATITWIETSGNGCVRTNTQTITINDLPTTKTIAGGTNACLGVDKAFSYTPAGTNTSNWTVTNGTGTASIVGANNTNTVSINGTVAGNVNLCVTETDPLTGCSRQHCATITINNLPTVQTIAGNGAVCINTSQTYTVAQVGGNTYSGTITGGNPTNPTFTGTSVTTTFQAAGTANICITETNPTTGCVNTYCRNITINALPIAQTITGATNACTGDTKNYSIAGAGTYTWAITGAGITATPNTGTGNTFSTVFGGVGTATITWTETDANACSFVNTHTVTIHALPTAPSFAPVTATCSGSTVTYTATGGTGTFEWEFTNVDNTTTTKTDNPTTFTWGTTATAVSRQVRVREISATPANCPSPYFTQNITINPLPTKQNITGETAVCLNEVESYSVPNTAGSSYIWKIGSTTVATTNPANITWNAGIGGVGTYTLTVEETNANGCKQTHDNPFSVQVFPLPTPTITGLNTGICANSVQNYTVTTPNALNAYNWVVTNGTVTSGQGTASVQITWGDFASGSITVTETSPAPASCVGTSAAYPITLIPAPAQPDIAGTTVTGNTSTVCANATQTYNIGTPSGTDTYIWEVTGGLIDGTLTTKSGVGLGNVSVNWGTNATGTLTVRRVAPAPASCSSATELVNVTINPLPIAQTITGATAVCQGQTQTYSVPNNPTNTFRWVITGGKIMPANVTAQEGVGLQSVSIQWDNTATVGKVELVEVSTANCEGAKITIDVIINPTPIITAISPLVATCGTSVVGYTVTGTGLTGATFDWNVTAGTPAITANGTSSLTITWNDVTAVTTGIISITPKTASCTGTAFTQNITINPLPATQTITGASPVCLNSTENYSLTGSVLSSYTWTVTSTTAGIANPASGIGATASIEWKQVGNATLEFEETIIGTGCKRKHTKAIIINTTPTTPTITGSTTVCRGGSSIFSVANPNNYTVLWEVLCVGDGTINGVNNGNSVNIDWAEPGTGATQCTVRVTLSAGSCTASSTQVINLKSIPAVTFTPTIATTCLKGCTTFTAPDAPTGEAYEYEWTTNGGTITSGQNAKVVTVCWNINNGTEYVRLKIKLVGANCEKISPLPATTTDLGFVTVNPLPTPDIIGDNVVCPGEVVTYNTANAVGNAYTWTPQNGTAVPTGNSVNITWGNTAGAGKVIVRQEITATGCFQMDTLNVTISPIPALPTSPDRSVCNPPKTITLSAMEASATSYNWYDVATGGTATNGQTFTPPAITGNISYWVSATNAAGCEGARKEVKIVVNPATTDIVIVPTLVNADSCVASGDSPSGKISLLLQGNNGPYTFNWTKAGTPTFTATTQNLTALTKGDYQVTITDAGGCTTVSPVYTILEQLKNLQDGTIVHNTIALADNQQIIVPMGLQTNLKAQGTDATKFEWKDATGTVISTDQTYTFTPNQDGEFVYTVKITNDRNCSMTRIVRIKVVRLTVYVPNLFTPNNDSKNDKLQVYGNGIKSVKFKVYNRLGEVIFETDKWVEGTTGDTSIGWDGFYNGKLQETGNYTWLLSVTYINETTQKETGNVYLKY